MEESLARWAGRPLGEKLLDYVQAVRREEGDLAEKAEPFQTLPSWTDRETGELLRALLRAGAQYRNIKIMLPLVTGVQEVRAAAPRDKGGAEWRSEPSSWNT